MNPHVQFALDNPVFDPGKQIVNGHYWVEERLVSACLTANLGME